MAYKKESTRSRTPLAITLIAASFLSALLLAAFSHRGSDFWIATSDLMVGHQIVAGDVELHHLDLDSSAPIYLASGDEPLGLIVKAKLSAGQILNVQSLSSEASAVASSAVPLSIRAADLASGVGMGEALDIYWVVDSQNGEIPVAPILILGEVMVLSFDEKGKNFGTDAAITVAVEQTQVLRLLTATTRGRLVLVRSHV